MARLDRIGTQVTRTPGCDERDRATGEDHCAHALGRICRACGRTTEQGRTPAGPERRTGCMTSARHGQLTADRPRLPALNRDGRPRVYRRQRTVLHDCAPARPGAYHRGPARHGAPAPSVTAFPLSPTEQAALCRRPPADLAFSEQYIADIRRAGRSATLCNQPSPRARARTPAVLRGERSIAVLSLPRADAGDLPPRRPHSRTGLCGARW